MPGLVKHPPLLQGAESEEEVLSTKGEDAESEEELADDPMVECDKVCILKTDIKHASVLQKSCYIKRWVTCQVGDRQHEPVPLLDGQKDGPTLPSATLKTQKFPSS